MTEPRQPKKKRPLGQSIGGVLFGFEQQVLRNQPPPHELVQHARPDDPVPAADGGFVTIDLPDDTDPDPLARMAFEPAGLADPVAAAAESDTDPRKD